MELCDLNLHDFIYGDPKLGLLFPIPRFIKNVPSSVKVAQIWNPMEHIACGLVYIHSIHEVHRDLKPRNSMSFCTEFV